MKYIKRISVDHNDPNYAISQRAFAPKGFVAHFVKSKKWYQCNHIEKVYQCLINISAERWSKLNETEISTILNHCHEYPVLENQEINLTEIVKNLFILIGKKRFHSIAPLQIILMILLDVQSKSLIIQMLNIDSLSK